MNANLVRYEPAKLELSLNADRLETMKVQWLTDLQWRVDAGDISLDTFNGYKYSVEKFLQWLKDQQPTSQVIRQWKAELLMGGYKPASVNSWLAGVRSFFGWLAEVEQIPFNPSSKIPSIRRRGGREKHSRQPLTDNEARHLLSKPDRSTKQGKRDYAILSVMLFTAARGIEMHRADLSDLDTRDEGLVLMVQGKGHLEKDAMVLLNGQAETAVSEWIAVRGSTPGPLFTSLSNKNMGGRLSRVALRAIVKGYFKAAGVRGKNKTTHSLRHTAITSAIHHGATVEKVRKMSRHASLDMLMVYYHEADRLEDPAENYISYEE